jgi:hypothetical protein
VDTPLLEPGGAGWQATNSTTVARLRSQGEGARGKGEGPPALVVALPPLNRLFVHRFEENDKKWDAKLEQKLGPIRTDLAAVRDAVKIILTRLP